MKTKLIRSFTGRRAARQTGALVAALTIVAAVTIPTSSAMAETRTCAKDLSVIGSHNTTQAATSTPGVNLCGSARTRALYQTYPGSPVYYAEWVIDPNTAISNPGNTVVGGNHDVTNPAPPYASNFPFST